MQPPTIDQQVTFLYCKNLEQTTQFYQEIFNLEMVLDQGTCRIFRVCENAFVGFCQKAEPPADKSSVVFTLVTQDVDGWHRHLAERGIQAEKPPTENPIYNIYQMFVRDHDGYLIEIQRFLDPAWPSN
jgi:catechol 2,3-dioxygenase-like lactoylglutathione lyase family enzyme